MGSNDEQNRRLIEDETVEDVLFDRSIASNTVLGLKRRDGNVVSITNNKTLDRVVVSYDSLKKIISLIEEHTI